MPDYYNLDVNIGYSFTIGKIKLDPRLTVLNAINAFYITDAQNNGYSGPTTPNHWQGGNAITFGATSASVNVGMGRRWLFSLVATF